MCQIALYYIRVCGFRGCAGDTDKHKDEAVIGTHNKHCLKHNLHLIP